MHGGDDGAGLNWPATTSVFIYKLHLSEKNQDVGCIIYIFSGILNATQRVTR